MVLQENHVKEITRMPNRSLKMLKEVIISNVALNKMYTFLVYIS